VIKSDFVSSKVRLSRREKNQILTCVERMSAKLAFGWEEIALFGSRTREDQKGGDIDLYIRIRRHPGTDLGLIKRQLLICLKDELGDQKFDLIIHDPTESLGTFGNIIARQKVILWTAKTKSS
jgi:predicted nucleotidyltransferase